MLINKQIVRIMKLIKKIARRVLRQELSKLDSDVRYYREKAYGKQDVILPTSLVDGIIRMLPDPNMANRNPMVIKQNSKICMGVYELSITEFHPGVGATILVEPLHIRIMITHRLDKLQANILGCNLEVDTFCWDLSYSGIRLVDDKTFAMIADFSVSSVNVAKAEGLLDYKK